MNPKKHQIYALFETQIPVDYFERDLLPYDKALKRAFTKYGFDTYDYTTVRFYNYKKKFDPKLYPGYSYLIFKVENQYFKTSARYVEYNTSSAFAANLAGLYELSDEYEDFIEILQFDEDM